MAAASSPTKYLVLGFSDLIAVKMTSATYMGEVWTDAVYKRSASTLQ